MYGMDLETEKQTEAIKVAFEKLLVEAENSFRKLEGEQCFLCGGGVIEKNCLW